MLNQVKWTATWSGNSWYAYRKSYPTRTNVYMHRVIMENPNGVQIDHIDGNTLNNQRSNLRICNATMNMVNKCSSGYKSKYIGVHPKRNNFACSVYYQGKKIHLGVYASETRAAELADTAKLVLHGKHCSLNFPSRAASLNDIKDVLAIIRSKIGFKILSVSQYLYFTKTTAIYPGANTGNSEEIRYLSLGLGSEVGEVQSLIQKAMRDGITDPVAWKEKMLFELGDCLYHIIRLCDALEGDPIQMLFESNYRKLQDRANRGVIKGSGDNR